MPFPGNRPMRQDGQSKIQNPKSKIEVVLPCFNAAATLPAALESIRGQTFEAWELIVFDDGSRDASAEVAAEFERIDTRIRTVRSRHVGIVEALRQACGEARGEFIARMDADDIAHPQRLERQLRVMHTTPDTAICGTQVKIAGPAAGSGARRYETWINALVTHEDIVRELFVECPLPHPTFMMRRDAYELVGGYEDRGWPEDYDLCLRFFLRGMKFGKVAEPLLEWTSSPGRLSMTDGRYSPASFREAKRHYLGLTFLKGRESFHQWGAGEVGKRWLREWPGPGPAAAVDINPRKIGRRIHGVPIIAPEDLPGPGETVILVAVGAPGARGEIRQWFDAGGYRELIDYVFVA